VAVVSAVGVQERQTAHNSHASTRQLYPAILPIKSHARAITVSGMAGVIK
jgi:hypothetical protein